MNELTKVAHELALDKVAFGDIPSAGHRSRESFMRHLTRRRQAEIVRNQPVMPDGSPVPPKVPAKPVAAKPK